MKRILPALLMAALVLSAGVVWGADSGTLRVGAAKVDITPPASMFPFVSQGPAGPTSRPSMVGVHDPLYVKAMVLDNGLVQLAILTYDLTTAVFADEFSKKISDAAGFPTDRILIIATHNHSIPPKMGETRADATGQQLMELLEKATLEAVRAARSKLQPARMGYGTGKAYINVNRDQKVGDRYMLGYNPEGPSEKTVYVLKFESLTGEPIAILTNYAVHAVVMFSAVTKDGGAEVTADIPGLTSRYVEAHYKNQPVVLWTSGASGDQNPIYMATYNQVMPDRTDLGAAGYALLEVQSRRLGEEVVRVADAIKADDSKVALWAGESSTMCPGGRITRVPNSGEVKYQDTDPYELKLRALTINDVAITGVNGEAVSLIGQRVKQASPFAKTIFVNHGGGSGSYIPDDASYPKLTFEVTSSRMKPGCAENAIVDGLVKLLKKAQTP
jgi:neutral ceramidase